MSNIDWPGVVTALTVISGVVGGGVAALLKYFSNKAAEQREHEAKMADRYERMTVLVMDHQRLNLDAIKDLTVTIAEAAQRFQCQGGCKNYQPPDSVLTVVR